MIKKEYIVISSLNHNTILCEGANKEGTYVFIGKGIGFKKAKGDPFIYDKNVENAMLVLKQKEADLYKELLSHVKNDALVSVVQEVVYEANQFFDKKVNSNLNITLLDHLNFALERQKQNIVMNYPFLNELRFIYPKEYEFSVKALAFINDNMKNNAHFEESELGFLVLHFHAAVTDSKVSSVVRNNQVLYDCTKIIEEETQEKVNYSSIYYARFTKHLEYAMERYKNGILLENVLLDSIKNTCSAEYEIALKINKTLKKVYRTDLDENEIGYLALHIYNLRNSNDR